ncbi:hypothetical protein BDW75DRAFT_62630 [Aspergillus navahoensis]
MPLVREPQPSRSIVHWAAIPDYSLFLCRIRRGWSNDREAPIVMKNDCSAFQSQTSVCTGEIWSVGMQMHANHPSFKQRHTRRRAWHSLTSSGAGALLLCCSRCLWVEKAGQYWTERECLESLAGTRGQVLIWICGCCCAMLPTPLQDFDSCYLKPQIQLP